MATWRAGIFYLFWGQIVCATVLYGNALLPLWNEYDVEHHLELYVYIQDMLTTFISMVR